MISWDRHSFSVSTKVIAAALSRASQRIAKEQLDNVPDALKQLVKSMKAGDAKALRKHVFSGNTISSMAGIVQRGGARSLRSFLKGHTNARYNQLQILAITAYLEWESACGKSLSNYQDTHSKFWTKNDHPLGLRYYPLPLGDYHDKSSQGPDFARCHALLSLCQ